MANRELETKLAETDYLFSDACRLFNLLAAPELSGIHMAQKYFRIGYFRARDLYEAWLVVRKPGREIGQLPKEGSSK